MKSQNRSKPSFNKEKININKPSNPAMMNWFIFSHKHPTSWSSVLYNEL